MCYYTGRWGKTSVYTWSNLFFKTLTVGDVTTESGSSSQYLTTLAENAEPLTMVWKVRFKVTVESPVIKLLV